MHITTDEKIFGSYSSQASYRKTVVVVLYNKDSKEFIYCDWPIYGLCCLVSGGLEDDESYIEAAKREVIEETGYINPEVGPKLGSKILSFYTDKHGTSKVKDIEAYLLFIDNASAKIESSLESDEDFIINSTTYESLMELLRNYRNPNGGGMEDHMRILEQAQHYIINNP